MWPHSRPRQQCVVCLTHYLQGSSGLWALTPAGTHLSLCHPHPQLSDLADALPLCFLQPMNTPDCSHGQSRDSSQIKVYYVLYLHT